MPKAGTQLQWGGKKNFQATSVGMAQQFIQKTEFPMSKKRSIKKALLVGKLHLAALGLQTPTSEELQKQLT